MNKIIKDQLNNVRNVKLNFSDDTKTIVIKKVNELSTNSLDIGHVYLIELSDFILNPSSSSTLAANWNKGIIPKHKIYKMEVLDKINNMIKFNGIAIEDGKELFSESWFGWLPEDKIKVLSKD